MPKQKSVKGLVKRVRVTKNGKVLSASAGSQHRRAIKNAKQRRRVSGTRPMSPTAAKAIRKVMTHNR